MEQTSLDTPFLTQGIAHVAFWNGRVLTAEDLQDEQQATLLSRRRLGRAVGSGIASGLNVTAGPSPSQLDISAGAALDLEGQALELPVDVTLSLVAPTEPITGDGVFVVCSNEPSTTPAGTGLYLLTMRPAEDQQSSAPGVSALGTGVATECGPRYTVDGVAFRLVQLDAAGLALAGGYDDDDQDVVATAATTSPSGLLRNTLAHIMLDTQPWLQLHANPFAVEFDSRPAAMETLRAGVIDDCEVPLALISWSDGGVDFADNWSVRRPVSSPLARTTAELLSDGDLPELSRAAFAQFQEELEVYRRRIVLRRINMRLADVARYLPAAGLVPIHRPEIGNRGFTLVNLFDGIATRGPQQISPNQAASLIQESFSHRPIDLNSGEVLHVYQVAEALGSQSNYFLFTTSRIEYLGEQLRIDAVFPGGPVVPGQTIEIRGAGFGFAEGLTRISFDTTPQNPQTGSSDNRLIVDVPLTLSPPRTGMEVVLEVSKNDESDSVPLRVIREQEPLTGFMQVDLVVTPARLIPGSPATIEYTVTSRLNEPAEVDLRLTTIPALANARLEFPSRADTTTSRFMMDPNETVDVHVIFDPVPSEPSINVELVAQADFIIGDHNEDFLTDVDIDPPDPRVTLAMTGTLTETVAPASISGTRISMGTNARATLSFALSVLDAGSYFARLEPTSLEAPWGVLLSDAPLPTLSDPNPELELVFSGGGSAQSIDISLANIAATDPLSVALIVRRAGGPPVAQRRTITLEPQ